MRELTPKQVADQAAPIAAYLEQRAQELAAPLIEQARRDAEETVKAARLDAQRQSDLVDELRRHIAVMERNLSRAAARQYTDGIRAERNLLHALVQEALHLRAAGECAPGGNETWGGWDRSAEATLRILDASDACAELPAGTSG